MLKGLVINYFRFFKITKRYVYKYDHIQKYYEEMVNLFPKTNSGLVQFKKQLFTRAMEE